MADQVKEIYAGTISASDVATNGSFTLVTTDANTKYVIKDVQVSNKFLGTPTLAINTFDTTSLATSVTGSEIVDVSSTVKYKVSATAPVFQKQTQAGYSTGHTSEKTETIYVGGSVAGSPVTTSVQGTALSYSPDTGIVYAVATNGDIYYAISDGNSTQALYRREVDGTNVTIVSLNYAWFIFDGVETIYYAGNAYGSTVIKKYNINTQVITQINVNKPVQGSSYPYATWTNNGKIATMWTGSTSAVILIDPVNGNVSNCSGMNGLGMGGTYFTLAVHYEESINRYVFFRRSANTLLRSQADNEIILGTNYSSGMFNKSAAITPNSISSSEILYAPASCTFNTFSQIRADFRNTYDFTSTSTSISTTNPYLPYSIRGGLYYDRLAVTTASEVAATVDVRVTGIKIT